MRAQPPEQGVTAWSSSRQKLTQRSSNCEVAKVHPDSQGIQMHQLYLRSHPHSPTVGLGRTSRLRTKGLLRMLLSMPTLLRFPTHRPNRGLSRGSTGHLHQSHRLPQCVVRGGTGRYRRRSTKIPPRLRGPVRCSPRHRTLHNGSKRFAARSRMWSRPGTPG